MCNKNDPKKLWKTLKRLTGNNTNSTTVINYCDNRITEPRSISETFNEYFINSIVQINATIETVEYQTLETRQFEIWETFDSITLFELYGIIVKMKSTSGIENINVVIIKYTLQSYGEQIFSLVNECLINGLSPCA